VYDIPVLPQYYYNPWDNSYVIEYPSVVELEIPDEEQDDDDQDDDDEEDADDPEEEVEEETP